MKHPAEMGEETDMSLYTGCPCDVLEFPEDELPLCSRNTPDISELPEYPDDGMTTLLPCIVCNRTFNPAALERHRKVCEKLSSKPRNVFDSTKKRLDELDVPRGLRSKDPPSPKAKSRWREKRAEFLRAIRAAKTTSEDDQNNEGHIPSDYIQCPHCSRHFGPKAADRHIEWCQEQKNRLPKYHTQEDTKAVDRLKKRTKYVPPRPGQSGWKAPKKKDVISSIPPQNAGASTITSGRHMMTPPVPHNRHISPPPMSPSRKPSSASLPPGPPRYNTGSLGRSAGRQFSSMLQNVTGCSPGYGLSSGYGSSAMYGSPSGQSTPGYGSNFRRSASLRLPRKRYGQKMARHRDLASDMLASVGAASSKRLDPEGDEDTQSLYAMSTYDRSTKPQDPHYDPFSAAELQFQSLLAPNESGRKNGMYRGRMGSTTSLNVSLKPEKDDYRRRQYKPRSSSVGPDYHNLSLLGLNPYEMRPDSGENSPLDLNSPEAALEDILAQFTNYKSPHFSPSSPFHMSPMRSPSRSPRISPTRTLGSPRAKSVEPFSDLIASLEMTAANRWPGDGANARKKSPSPALEYGRKSKESSPLRTYGQSTNRKDDNSKYRELNGNSPSYGWSENSQNSFHRNRKSVSPPKGTTLDAANSAYDSIKILKASMDEDISLDKKYNLLDSPQKRTSSGSSTDSSLPLLSSPSSVSMDQSKTVETVAQLTRFCHECGQKYPVAAAKFCCQCGARRINP